MRKGEGGGSREEREWSREGEAGREGNGQGRSGVNFKERETEMKEARRGKEKEKGRVVWDMKKNEGLEKRGRRDGKGTVRRSEGREGKREMKETEGSGGERKEREEWEMKE